MKILKVIASAKRKVSNTWYKVRCFFFPFNVVRIQALPRTWVDRDDVMFHAVFQILVDFVELEKPFHACDHRHCRKEKRHTNREEMRAWVEYLNTQEYRDSLYPDWSTPEYRASTDKYITERYQIEKEILYLYEWYKDKKYEFDFDRYYRATGESVSLDNGKIEHVNAKQPKLITRNEFFEIEDEHKLVCDLMLRRVLAVRPYLWT